MAVVNKLKGSKAPNLPISPVDYTQRYHDQFSNVLRLYFNEIDNIFAAIFSDTAGGHHISFPYIGAYDTTNQYATANNTPTIVAWDTLDAGSGFTLNANNTATADYSGIYKIDYSLQFANTDNASHDVVVWLRINGSTSTADLAGSASKFTLTQRKSVGNYTYLVAYSSIVFEVNGGDTVGLWWATDKAYSTVGPVDGVYMAYSAAQTVPYAHPSIPSAVGSITFLSALP